MDSFSQTGYSLLNMPPTLPWRSRSTMLLCRCCWPSRRSMGHTTYVPCCLARRAIAVIMGPSSGSSLVSFWPRHVSGSTMTSVPWVPSWSTRFAMRSVDRLPTRNPMLAIRTGRPAVYSEGLRARPLGALAVWALLTALSRPTVRAGNPTTESLRNSRLFNEFDISPLNLNRSATLNVASRVLPGPDVRFT